MDEMDRPGSHGQLTVKAPDNRIADHPGVTLTCENIRAGEGNRTLMTSLEGWGSAIELRPRWPRRHRARRDRYPGSVPSPCPRLVGTPTWQPRGVARS